MDFKEIAQQLRKPDGEVGKRVGIKMNDGNAWITKFTVDALELTSNDQVLEIGMGNGAFVKDILAKESSVNYIGCDFSPTMIEEARRLNKELLATGRVQFSESAVHHLPFPSENFDIIFSVNTIYFWDNPEKELKEIKRVLKKNGRFLISLRPKSMMKDMPFVQYGFNLYEKEDVEKILIKNDFQVTKVIEKKEPDQNMEGMVLKLTSLIVIAQKK